MSKPGSVEELFSLAGRTALVTGGSRGIGQAMAEALAMAGANLVISSRHEDELREALAAIMEGRPGEGIYVVADLANREEAAVLADAALERFGAVDVLVHNAGNTAHEACDEITDAAWDDVLGVHLNAAMALTRALSPAMKENRWGRIIFTTSLLAFQGMAERGAYSAAKGALTSLARGIANDLGPYGITANCIAPGAFATEMQKRWLPPELKAVVDGRSTIGRGGEPEELMGPVLLLASDAGSFISGSTIPVEGGWLAK